MPPARVGTILACGPLGGGCRWQNEAKKVIGRQKGSETLLLTGLHEPHLQLAGEGPGCVVQQFVVG